MLKPPVVGRVVYLLRLYVSYGITVGPMITSISELGRPLIVISSSFRVELYQYIT